MLQLGAISHPDPLVDKKVKFFHDSFHYCLLDNAKKIDGFPENHLTYLERMLFRVETLSKMHQSSRMAICSWLEQPEFDTDTDEFSKQATIKPLVLRLKQISTQTKNNFDIKLFRETATKIVEELNGSDGLNGSLYFHEVLKSQISLLSCVHELEEHSEEIMTNSRWLVAEYLRQGFDEKGLNGLNSVFKRIMKFGELKASAKPHAVGFPLPSELREKRSSKRFKPALKKYFENNAFVTQFEGMLNALRETQNGEIYFRVNGLRKHGEGDFEFSYAGVTLMTADKIPFDRFGLSDFSKNDFDEFFGTTNTVVARVPILFKSKEQAISIAKFQANRALDALRYVLDKSGGSISANRVIIVWSGGGANYQMNRDENIEVGKFDLDILQKFEKTIPYPENISAEVRRYLDRCNRIFFKGLSCENPDDIISHFWQYWETAFGHYEQKGKAERLINDLSSILAIKRHANSKMWIGLLIFNYAINNNGNEVVGIPAFYYRRDFDFDNPEKTVQKVKDYSNYPFLKILIERFETIDSTTEDLRWKKFYTGFLWQLYEQRNFILHDGTYCPATLERLKFYFRSIVVSWQSKLFEELEKSPNSTVQAAIERLILKPQVL
jgi:hypothetical protein